MGALLVLAVTFVLLWVIFILPQQRRVRGHQALVASLEVGDEVVLTAGIYGRIVDIGPEDLSVEVAPGVVLRVARQAVLRRVEDATAEPAGLPATDDLPAAGTDIALEPAFEPDLDTDPSGATGTPTPSDAPAPEAAPDTDDRGPATPGTPQ
ncbi:MAG TPA: preprotein translocase subunit YajC [Acidimicrobiales bacterium]|nr:preprotein translocase subunit YajC [Acidimicrobiales bacterium]